MAKYREKPVRVKCPECHGMVRPRQDGTYGEHKITWSRDLKRCPNSREKIENTMGFTKYVVGFLFSTDLKAVALIRKNRPEWQAEFFNGIGGHVEDGETPLDAMRREFLEETGVLINHWIHIIIYNGEDYRVDFYYAISDKLYSCKTVTDEGVQIRFLHDIGNAVPNLRWLIPTMLDTDIQLMTVDSKHSDAKARGGE